jgi:HPr kinase/phosphorylase
VSAGRDSITIRELCEDTALGIPLAVAAGQNGLDRRIRSTRIQKSGLALAGHFHGIEPGRLQIFGMTELTYLRGLKPERCQLAVRRFFELDLCGVIITESDKAMASSAAAEALVACADETETPLLLSPERSSRTIMALHALLDERLAPRQRIHGVLVDVFEVGLLLLGSSGVGKSEVALELVMRGHRLVADDVVDCMYRPPGMVFGQPADLLRHHLEVRGLGILNVKDLFGVTAIRERKRIDVVVQLVESVLEGDYDRLGLEQRFHEILGVDVPELLVPVRPGRDMASILEIAARNELLRMSGHHPAKEFFGRIEGAILGSESDLPSGVTTPRAPRPSGSAPFPGSGPEGPELSRPPESSVGMPWRAPRGK